MTLVARLWFLCFVALAAGGGGYALGYWHGTPPFLKCLKCRARLRGLCPHCKRDQQL